MKQLKFAAAALLVIVARGSAQQQPVRLSLADALARAEAASPTIGLARAGVMSAHADYLRTRSAFLPQLNGSASYTRTLASQYSAFASSTTSDTFPKPVNCAHFSPNPTLSVTSRLDSLEHALDCTANGSAFDISSLPFGQKNNWTIGLTGSQSLLDPKMSGQMAAARAGEERADVELTAQRTQAKLDVAAAYLDVQLAERLLEIADSTLTQAQRTFEQTRLERQVGNAAEFDQLRASVARDNQNPIVIQRRAQRDQAVLRLRQLLDLPGNAPLVLLTPLGDTVTTAPPALVPEFAATADTSITQRAPVREAMLTLKAGDGSVSAAKAARLPTVSLSSAYANIDYPANVFSFDKFLTDWTVGVRMDVPIFTGGRLQAGVLSAEAGREQSAMRVKQAQQQAQRDVQDVTLQLASAQAVWEAVRGTVDQATRAYAIAELRYRNGLSTLTEVGEARVQLGQAEANRAQAVRDFQIARIRVALLRDLPFGAPGAPGTQ
jgi:outer membrane protein